MKFEPTDIPEVIRVRPQVFEDERGFFMETWQRETFAAGGIDHDFVQDNHSCSEQRVLRGLHYQIQQPQGKLVRVVQGEIFDVAVDLRQRAATFGQWVGVHLSHHNRQQLWVPPGFAHGFLVLSESAEVIYKCSDYYAPEHERSLRWDDPDIGINWPLPEGVEPIVSKKDQLGLSLAEAEVYP